MKAVVMAGGFGTRLRPITCNIPKPMAPVANVPMMEHIVNLLKTHNLREVCSILYFQPEVITKYFGEGTDFDIEMDYQMATADFGTAGSVKNAEEKLKDDTFLIISGDVLTDFDLEAAINFHKERGAMATMVLTRVANPLEFGVVITEEDGKIVRFLEKPSWGEVFSDTINTGIYILEPEIFKYIPANTEFDFSKNLFPLMLKEQLPLFGYIAEGYWKDIGSIEEYMAAQRNVLDGEVRVNLPGERLNVIGRDVWVGKNSTFSPKVKFKGGVIIGSNCIIEDGVSLENCVIGDGCVIKKNSKIRNATIWDSVHIGERAEINSCVIATNSHIEDNVFIEHGVVISEDCNIGKDAVIRENVKIWPKKKVEEGSTVLSSIIWSDKWSKNLFTDLAITGLANIEITPETATKIGAAFGSTLPKASSLIVSRDSHKVSRMLNRALICGLISSGINVADLRSTPEPVARFKPYLFLRGGGLHVKVSDDDPNQVEIKIFDNEGRDISVNQKKSIERIFNREDFRRASVGEVGEISFPPRVPDNYSEELVRYIDLESIRKRRLKVVLDYASSDASGIFNTFMGKFNADIIALNAHNDESRIDIVPLENSISNVSSIVKSLGADFGVIIGNGCERITIIDDLGRPLSGEQALIVWATMSLKFFKGAKIAVPVSVTSQLEKIAEQYSGEIIRTKTGVRALNTAAISEDADLCLDEKGGVIFPAFQVAFDGIVATVKLFEAVSKLDMPLSTVVDQIPECFTKSLRVPCPWEVKGKVMRYAMDFAKGKKTVLLDGIKVYNSDSEDEWAFIFPDPDKPFINLSVESTSMKKAEDLLEKLSSLLDDWIAAE